MAITSSPPGSLPSSAWASVSPARDYHKSGVHISERRGLGKYLMHPSHYAVSIKDIDARDPLMIYLFLMPRQPLCLSISEGRSPQKPPGI